MLLLHLIPLDSGFESPQRSSNPEYLGLRCNNLPFPAVGHSHSPDEDRADNLHSHPDDARRRHRSLLKVLLRRAQQDRLHGPLVRRMRRTTRRGLRPSEPESQVTLKGLHAFTYRVVHQDFTQQN